jgi:hypothetical protein
MCDWEYDAFFFELENFYWDRPLISLFFIGYFFDLQMYFRLLLRMKKDSGKTLKLYILKFLHLVFSPTIV